MIFSWLLLIVPLSLGLHYFSNVGPVWIFVTAILAIVPLAEWIRRATENLAERAGPAVGGLLNVTFGNTAEFILALFLLAAGEQSVVKGQITGSIIGNSLLGLGLAIVVGGWGRERQRFKRERAGLLSSLLILATIVQTNTGGNPAEICQPTTSTLGHYTIIQTFQTNQQVSANSVVPLTNSRPTFISLAKDPPGDKGFTPPGTVTNGSLTLPDGTDLAFTNLGRIVVDLGIYYTNTTDAEVTTAFPPGDYVMRLVQLSNVVSTITMTLPGAPPIPMIANYDAVQTIDAGSDFVLQWNSLPATSPGPFIQLAIYDSFGKLIFAAPNPCVSRTLDPGATSVLIPANTFRPGVLYKGMLEFGYRFYYETNAVPQMVGDGIVGGTTTFQLRTSLAANTASAPPTFSTTTLSFSGQPVITFHGAPGASYTIQRTHNVFTALRGTIGPATWTTAGTVATDGSGNGSFTDTTATLPAFYRIVGQ